MSQVCLWTETANTRNDDIVSIDLFRIEQTAAQTSATTGLPAEAFVSGKQTSQTRVAHPIKNILCCVVVVFAAILSFSDGGPARGAAASVRAQHQRPLREPLVHGQGSFTVGSDGCSWGCRGLFIPKTCLLFRPSLPGPSTAAVAFCFVKRLVAARARHLGNGNTKANHRL